MMYPSAVHGHMPFVDKYKQEQIKKVIEKHRARHHSGPDKASSEKSVKQRNTHSMPILWQSVYAGQRPKFISMPTLDDNRRISQDHLHKSKDGKTASKSLLNSLKNFFTGKKDDMTDSAMLHKAAATGAIIQGNSGRPYSSSPIQTGGKKPASDSDIVVSGAKSPKRQRMRTISNISGVMETIEEVNEVMASTDNLSDDSSSFEETPRLRTSASAPETSLFYSCGNLSNHTDSSSSHQGSGELILAL